MQENYAQQWSNKEEQKESYEEEIYHLKEEIANKDKLILSLGDSLDCLLRRVDWEEERFEQNKYKLIVGG